MNGMIAHARHHWPAFQLRAIVLEDGAVALEGQAGQLLVRDGANRLWFDARTGHALRRDDAMALGLHNRISEAADPLHFGSWGGLPTRLAWFACGLLLCVLSVAGLYITALRLAPGGNRMRALLRSMGMGAVIAIVLVAWAIFGVVRAAWN